MIRAHFASSWLKSLSPGIGYERRIILPPHSPESTVLTEIVRTTTAVIAPQVLQTKYRGYLNGHSKTPLTPATAHEKLAQSMWSMQDPAAVSEGSTPGDIWRSCTTFMKSTDEVLSFLTARWKKKDCRLRKEPFAVWERTRRRLMCGFGMSSAMQKM